MSSTVDITKLTDKLLQYVNEFNEDVEKSVRKHADELSKEAKDKLVGSTVYKDTKTKYHEAGYYRKGWSFKTQQGEHHYRRIVYNRNSPQIVHLLEFGHKSNWAKSGWVEAKEHVRPVELEMMQKFIKKVKEDCNS